MQDVAQSTVSDSERESSSQNSDSHSNLGSGTPEKCQTYADLQDKFCTSSAEYDSEEDLSEVESFMLGEGDDDEVGVVTRGAMSRNRYLLASTQVSVTDAQTLSELGASGSALPSNPYAHTQFDPDTQARFVAMLEAAGPDVLRRLSSSMSSALDDALTRIRSDAVASGVVHSSSTNGSSSGTGGCSSKGSSPSVSVNSVAAAAQRTLVEACTDGDVLTVQRLLDEGQSVNEITEEGESLLSLACSAGYYDLAQVLLTMRANVEDRGSKGDCTPLMEAASAGHLEIVKLLVAHNADVNAQSSSANTPLICACAGGHYEVVKFLLEHGARVEDHNENGHTPLMEAASAGHVDIAMLLLEHGAGINTSSNEFKESALTLAAYKGHYDMVKFLLEAGADQDHKTDEMHTALMEASMDGHVEVARLLLDSGAEVNMPNESFESPLTLAACGGHTELAMLLLERGANIDEVNDEGYTPLMEAAREGHEEMVNLLLANGAAINIQTEETQETALTLACCGGFREVADLLLRHGADIEMGASTPLMEAAQEGHRDLVEYLIECGANVHAQTQTGDTALTYACENGHTDVADLLLSAGADLEHESEGGRTPLMKACRAGHLCTVQFLAMKGADLNKTTTDNDHTPLSLACVGGYEKVVEFLLANGANPYHKLKDNYTMLMEASKGGHTAVVKLLLDFPQSVAPLLHCGLSSQSQDIVADTTHSSVGEGNSLTGISQNHSLPVGLVLPGADSQQLPQVVLDAAAASSTAGNEDCAYDQDGMAPVSSATCAVQTSGMGKIFKLNKGVRKIPSSTTTAALPPVQNLEKNFMEAVIGELKFDLANSLPGSSPLCHEDAKNGHTKLLDHYVDSLVHRKSEKSKQTEQILEELQKREAGQNRTGSCISTVSLSSIPGTTHSVPVTFTASSPPSTLISSPTLISTHTVETQTGYLSGSPWALLPQVVGLSDPSSPKCSSQLPLTLYSPGTAQLPISLPIEEISCSQLDSSPISSPHHLPKMQIGTPCLSGPASVNVPVSERPKMIPSKKADKKKQQILVKQQQQQQLTSSENLHSVGNTVATQSSLVSDSTTQVLHPGHCYPPPPPPPLSPQEQQRLIKSNKLSESALGKVGKKDKKRNHPKDDSAILSDDALSNVRYPSDMTDLVSSQLGAQLHLSAGLGAAPSSSVQFVPTSGVANSACLPYTSFPVGGNTLLPYGHVPALGTPQSTAVSNLAVSSSNQHLQNFVTISSGMITAAADSIAYAKSMKQFLLQPTNLQSVNSNIAQSGSITTSFTSDQLQTHGGLLLSSQSIKKAKKQVKGTKQDQDLSQQQFQYLLPSVATTENQPSFSLDSMAAQNIVYANNVANHLQASLGTHAGGIPLPSSTARQLAPNFPSPLHGADVSDVLIVPQATPAKTLNDQLTEIISNTSQVVPTQPVISNVPSAATLPYLPTHVASQHSNAAVLTAPLGPYRDALQNCGGGIDIECKSDSNHDTALTLACAGGHDELVEFLISRNANIEHKDKKGFTPLILAATAGHCKVVEKLLKANAKIEAMTERSKDTPLSLACSGGRADVVELLLKKGANKEHRNQSDYTPLSLAASGGYINIIRLLLEHGAEINSRTGSKLGISPLMLAAMNGHTSAVRDLLEMGSDINAQIETNHNTALTLACFQGRHEVVSLLLDKKANIEHRAKTGLTPLMEAASAGYVEVGRILLDRGADVNAPPVPSTRDTALYIAADKGHTKFVELLVERGAQIDVKNKKGNSPLWIACSKGYLDIVPLLYDAGADVDSEDNRKVSCIMAAFKNGHTKVVKFLVKHVTQLPSDQELTRYIAAQNDSTLIKRCGQCLEIIRAVKDKQTQEANKNAKILLQELEQEKSREESKRMAATRRRLKKKAKKAEKREEKRRMLKEYSRNEKGNDDDDDEDDDLDRCASPALEQKNELDEGDDDEDEEEEEEEDDEEEEEEEEDEEEEKKNNIKKKISVLHIAPSIPEKQRNGHVERSNYIDGASQPTEEKDGGDSGIDSNSQTSVTSVPPKTEEKEVPKGKKKKKKKKELNRKESRRNEENTGPAVKNLENSYISDVKLPKKELEYKYENDNLYFEKVKPVKRDTFSEMDHFIIPSIIPGLHGVSSTTLSAPSLSPSTKSPPGTGTSPKKGMRRDDGWREVSRKSKKVSVPSTAISRVIGRGGCNINAIREASSAHIEVEKQGKSQGDRMIIIKGSMEATRQAQMLIAALVKDPEKDLAELIPKSVAKVASKAAKAAAAASQDASHGFKSSRLSGLSSNGAASYTSVTSNSVSIITKPSSTGSAWSATVASPKRTPTQLKSVCASGIVSSQSKSPAVRQLFPGDKGSLISSLKSSIVENQSFAAKVADSTKCGSKSTTPPHIGSPKIAATASTMTPFVPTSTASDIHSISVEVKHKTETSHNSESQYSIFNNPLSQAAQEVWGARSLNFAQVASEGLVGRRNPPASNHNSVSPSISSSYDTVELKRVEASLAPGYRGNTILTAVNSQVSPSSVSSLINSASGNIPLSGGISNSAMTSPQLPQSQTVGPRSAPGTPVASPHIRPVGMVSSTRQSSTPPLIQRTLELGTGYGPLLGNASQTPPPQQSVVRMNLPPATLAPGTPLPPRNHQAPAAGMAQLGPQNIPVGSVASLAPGGPVSSISRGHIQVEQPNDFVNLTPGQPYRKMPHHVQMPIVENPNVIPFPPQWKSVAHMGLVNGPRFTTPQTNTHPVFTNNILAPISAAPQIQSNLNPNAPDFSSRTYVQPPFPPRSQLAQFQNGMAQSIGFGGLHSYPSTVEGLHMPPTGALDYVVRPPVQPVPATMTNAVSFRSHNSHEVVDSPHSSNAASPTQSVGVQPNGPLMNCGNMIMGLSEEKQMKLQPIGTERAQKRLGAPIPNALGLAPGEMLCQQRQEYHVQLASGPHLEHPPNVYYGGDMEYTHYNQFQ